MRPEEEEEGLDDENRNTAGGLASERPILENEEAEREGSVEIEAQEVEPRAEPAYEHFRDMLVEERINEEALEHESSLNRPNLVRARCDDSIQPHLR